MAAALWHRLADPLLAVTLAPRCAACDAVLDAPSAGAVCPSCWLSVRALPGFLGDAATANVARWRAAGEYDGALRKILHAFKYDDRRALARPLGGLMRAAAGDLLDGAACVIPVPLHPWRRLRRGFNQASLLSTQLGLPVVHALWRTRWTTPQAGLSRDVRTGNVRRAFRLSPLLTRRRTARSITNRVVVLVDDVRTTGATLEACARVLRDAGAADVRALTAGAVIVQRR